MSSAFDAKKTAEEKTKRLQAQVKALAKEKKDAEKAQRQRKRLEDMKAKSMAGKEAARKKEEETLKNMSEEELLQMERDFIYMEKLKIQREEDGLRKKAVRQTLASQQGEESLFKAKLSKEARKAQQAAKRAAKKREKDNGDTTAANKSERADLPPAPPVPAKKDDALTKVSKEQSEVETELESAILMAAKSRREIGAYKGHIEARSFTLANPGGGANLLEDAQCILVRGKIYGLIGRNGKGKSTMLRALAARRVGDVPPNVSVHYVSQEVKLTEMTKR